MNKVYGKALGAYRRINNIKSALMNVDDARIEGQKKRAEATSKAQDLMYEKQNMSNISNAVLTAAGVAGEKMNLFSDPDMNKQVMAGLSAVKDMAIDVKFNKREKDSGLAGAMGNEYMGFRDKMSSGSNIASNAMGVYNQFDTLQQDDKNWEIEKQLKNFDYESMGLSEKEARNFLVDSAEYKGPDPTSRFGMGEGYVIDGNKAAESYLQNQKSSNFISQDRFAALKKSIGEDRNDPLKGFRDYLNGSQSSNAQSEEEKRISDWNKGIR